MNLVRYWGLGLLLFCSIVWGQEQRFISLAPNITEIIYAAGAGSKLVGVSDFSNYPPQASSLPRVASYTGIDVETILRLDPTHVFYWRTGNSADEVNQLQQLNIKTQAISVRQFSDVIQAINKIGQIAGTSQQAQHKSAQLLAEYEHLQQRYHHKKPVSVFYQVSASPLLTIGQHSYINDLIRQCGGRNIIHDTVGSAPEVNLPTLLKRQPQVIVIGKSAHDATNYHQFWDNWQSLQAVQKGHVFTIKASWINRPGPRLIKGMKRLCHVIDQVRQAKLAS